MKMAKEAPIKNHYNCSHGFLGTNVRMCETAPAPDL